MAKLTAEQVLRRAQEKAAKGARRIVTTRMNALKKAQSKGNPIEGDGESFRRGFIYEIANEILLAGGADLLKENDPLFGDAMKARTPK